MSIRDRREVRLDGWNAYVQAIGAQMDINGADALDRVQTSKRRLRDFLERLESEANEAENLAIAARLNLHRASSWLRRELSSPRPDTAVRYAAQKQAIVASIAAAESELNSIAVSPRHGTGSRLNGVIERTMRAMVRLEAELEAAEMRFRALAPGAADLPPIVERDLAERLRTLAAAIAIARSLTEEDSKLVEAEIASGIRSVRNLFAAVSR